MLASTALPECQAAWTRAFEASALSATKSGRRSCMRPGCAGVTQMLPLQPQRTTIIMTRRCLVPTQQTSQDLTRVYSHKKAYGTNA